MGERKREKRESWNGTGPGVGTLVDRPKGGGKEKKKEWKKEEAGPRVQLLSSCFFISHLIQYQAN